jgi:hypothetical protein
MIFIAQQENHLFKLWKEKDSQYAKLEAFLCGGILASMPYNKNAETSVTARVFKPQ